MGVTQDGGGLTLGAPERLRALERTGLVDTPAEEPFDRLTRLAAASVRAPSALLTLVLPGRVFVKSALGLPEPWAARRELPLGHTFCSRAVLSGTLLAVEDARADPDAPEGAVSELGVAACLAVPLGTAGGPLVGALSALDTEPRDWRADELELIEDLGAVASDLIAARSGRAGRTHGHDARGVEGHQTGAGAHGERGLNIAAVAQRTGVAADTLRKWERRYGVLRPMRTPGGQRRYDESDLAVVRWLKARLEEGYRISEAAALLGVPGDPASSPQELVELVLEGVRAGDAERLARLLDQAFALPQVEATLLRVVAPVLVRVGTEWQEGALDVAREHLVSAAVRARLDRLLADARGGVRGPVVLACAPGERHELGLLMLAVLLHADGWRVAVLGADSPLEDTFAFAGETDARVLCLSASLPARVDELADRLNGGRPAGLEVVLGGRAVTRERAEAAGAQFVGNDPLDAIGGLRRLVA